MNEQERAGLIEDVLGDYEILLARLADANSPEFLEIDITMPQAKVLYLLASGDLNMSELVARLGVTLPTVSGIVDRLVEHGLVARRATRSDRRRVFVGLTPAGLELVDRFRDLNARQVRELLGVLDDADLGLVRGFLGVLDRGVTRLAATGRLPAASKIDPEDRAPARGDSPAIPIIAQAPMAAHDGAPRSTRS